MPIQRPRMPYGEALTREALKAMAELLVQISDSERVFDELPVIGWITPVEYVNSYISEEMKSNEGQA